MIFAEFDVYHRGQFESSVFHWNWAAQAQCENTCFGCVKLKTRWNRARLNVAQIPPGCWTLKIFYFQCIYASEYRTRI